jgi:hypothetical protein
MEHYFVYSKDVLGVRTNTPDWSWSFGSCAPPARAEDYAKCRLRMTVNVVPDGELTSPHGSTTASSGRYHYFSGYPGGDTTQYDRRFLFNRRLRLEAKGLLGDEPTLTVNRTYHRYISHRFMNLHSVGYVMTDLAALLLLRRGLAPLHCSAFRHGDATVVVFAPPNCGKTLTTMTACLKDGAGFIAEDLAISDGRTIFAVPWTSTFRYYPQLNGNGHGSTQRRVIDAIPVLELLPLSRSRRVDTFIDGARIVHAAPITHVVVLERGASTRVSKVAPSELYRKVVNLNRYEFKYERAPMVLAHEFLNPALDVDAACQQERKVLHEMVAGAETLVVTAADPNQYAPALLHSLGGSAASLSSRSNQVA